MPKPLSHCLLLPGAAAVLSVSLPAIASTQPMGSENPFATDDIAGIIQSTGGNSTGSTVGEGMGGFPSFPGVPDVSRPEAAGENILGTVNDVLRNPMEGALDILGRTLPEGFPAGVPDIFQDIFGGNIGDILGGIFDIFKTENDIFEEISRVVLGDGWEGAGTDHKAQTPPDPYRIRLPTASATDSRSTTGEADKAIGLLTRTPIVYRRDKANQYDQGLSRAMAAPMLGEAGQTWIEGEIEISAELLKKGADNATSLLGKSTEATQATSTQDIVRATAQMSGLAAGMQMQEMQQNAKMQQSLWQMQRTGSAQLQLIANMSEAADEENRRNRADRSSSLSGAAYSFMIVPGLGSTTADSTAETIPEASNLFAD